MSGYGNDYDDGLPSIGLIAMIILAVAGLTLLIVWLMVRHTPNSYEYCSSGWSAICINSPTKLVPDKNGCVQNDHGRLCQYEVHYGQF